MQRELSNTPASPERRPLALVDDQLADDDAFSSQSRPWPYSVDNGRTYYCTQKKTKDGFEMVRVRVCEFEAWIQEDVVNEQGERSFLIAGRAPKTGDFKMEITAERLADDRMFKSDLVKAAGSEATVYKGMSGHLFPAITRLSNDIAHAYRFNRTGWYDDTFLMPGREAPNTSIQLPHKLAYATEPDADLALGLGALNSLLQAQRPEMATVAAATLFQAPLAHLARWRNERYCLFIAGRTGSLKSSWAQTAMCLYGADFIEDDRLIKFGEGATRVAIMLFAATCHDLPFLLDNYKPNTGGGAKDFVNVIHNILEGGDKDRGTMQATLRESKPIFCWPIVTGEDVPDTDAAALARVLVVSFAWPSGEENPHLSDAQNRSPHLNAVGNYWLNWLESEDGRAAAAQAESQFRDRRSEWSSYLRSRRADMVNVSRVASNLATNELTWLTMMQCPALAEITKTFAQAHHDGLVEIAGQMAAHTAESLEATRYLSALRVLLAQGRLVLLSRFAPDKIVESNQVMCGWYDNEDNGGAYILPEVVHKEVLNLLRDAGGLNGVSTQTLYKQLDTLGAIQERGRDRITKVVKINNRTQRVLHFSADALNGKLDGDEDETQTELL